MKFVAFFVFACFAIFSVFAAREQIWGNVNARQIGVERVVAAAVTLQVQTRTVTFPRVSK